MAVTVQTALENACTHRAGSMQGTLAELTHLEQLTWSLGSFVTEALLAPLLATVAAFSGAKQAASDRCAVA